MRNAANALKSTGPKTDVGKARVSQNARRHGVTSQPDAKTVLAWARVILDKPDLSPADLLRDGGRVAAAFNLAEAEVRLLVAASALDDLERGVAGPSDVARRLQGVTSDIIREIRIGMGGSQGEQMALSILRRLNGTVSYDVVQGSKRQQLLKRYVGEARSHRKRAFAVWISCLDQTEEPTPPGV